VPSGACPRPLAGPTPFGEYGATAGTQCRGYRITQVPDPAR
jgi:hypothetical protein